jgi:hypothetical protein
MIIGASPLSSIATSDVGQWLGGVLAAVLDGPGDLYNPVYVGPLPVVVTLREALGAAAAEHSLVVAESPVPPTGPGVWLAGVEEAEAAIASGRMPRPGVQWIVWSGAASSALPDRLAGWLGATGLTLDPFAGAAGSMGAWSMDPAVRAFLGARAGPDPGFVLVVGDRHDLGTLAAELQLHLEIALEEPVWRGPVEGWCMGEGPRSACVLVVTPGTDLAAVCSRLAALAPASCPMGVVLEREDAERLVRLPEWEALRARSAWLRHTSEVVRVDEGAFPAVSDLLVGPWVGRAPDGIAQFDLGAVSLPEILQSAEGWARCGTLIIFGADHAGYVQIGAGRVCGAGFYGPEGPHGRVEERDVHDVLCTLTTWVGAAGVFVPGETGPGRVPIGRVVMALAHASSAERSRYDFPTLRPHEVAGVLLGWGLAEVASGFLRRAELVAAWGPEEDVLLGSLAAIHEPEAASARLRHGALRAFSERGADGGTAIYVNGMLNALLVEVRGGHTLPAAAWSIVSGWVRDAGWAWASTTSHVAIWMELALRAGARDAAIAAQDRLRELSDTSGRWAGLLGIPLSEPPNG